MYATDPTSVRQIRQGDLIEAGEHHRAHRWDPARARRRRLPTLWRRTPKPTVLDGSLELFAGLDRRTLDKLSRRFLIVDLAEGESLGRQGETVSEFTIVLDGRIGVTLDGVPLAIFDRGSQFGALPLLDGGPGRFRHASFDVLEPTRVAIADRVQFFEILHRHSLVGQRIRRVAEQRRAYLRDHADAKALAADLDAEPFPVHIPQTV